MTGIEKVNEKTWETLEMLKFGANGKSVSIREKNKQAIHYVKEASGNVYLCIVN